MSPPTQAPTAAPTDDPTNDPVARSLDPGAAARWAAWRRPLAVATLVLAVALVLGWVASGERRGYLDPEGVDQTGARALARILAAEGVDVVPARTTADVESAVDRAPSTVLVTVPALLSETQVGRVLATGADLVLISPGAEVAAWVPGVEAVDSQAPETLDPGCALPEARRAGTARQGGALYAAPEATTCYAVDAGAALVVADQGDRRVTVLGSADALTNRYLDEDGNASLATGLLGRSPRLVWYRPVLESGDEPGVPLTALLPGWVAPVAGQLLLAAAVTALWRGRRLGPVVREPLPVTVRSVEAVEGRARLYRRGRARGHAADALRRATVERLRAGLGLPRGSAASAVAVAAAHRTGRAEAEVTALLTGPAPADDSALVRLTDDLDRLEQEVLRQ
ncbi:MAG TPA: DUF4350 domain-containing protein [Jiangellales bacterium]|nr:DUF4350 domain-containing protein [Jiangellales bacterium]